MARQSGTVRVGQPAPTLVGTTTDGERYDLQALRPRAVLVEFHRGTW